MKNICNNECNFKTCSFFGHRNIEITEKLKKELFQIITELIVNYNVSIFLFGSRSNFNNFCHYVVTELKIKFPKIKRVFYSCKNEMCILEKDRESLEKAFYISTKKPVKFCAYEQEVEHKTKFISGRASYIERNKAMILDSDFCVFYYDETYKPELRKISKNSIGYYQPKSGTAIAYNFAKQKKKTIINVAR